jgi:hypothetical protein
MYLRRDSNLKVDCNKLLIKGNGNSLFQEISRKNAILALMKKEINFAHFCGYFFYLMRKRRSYFEGG